MSEDPKPKYPVSIHQGNICPFHKTQDGTRDSGPETANSGTWDSKTGERGDMGSRGLRGHRDSSHISDDETNLYGILRSVDFLK